MNPRRFFDVLPVAIAIAAFFVACSHRTQPPPREFDIAFSSSASPLLVGADTLDDAEQRLWRTAARAAAEVVGVVTDCPPVRVRFEPSPAGGGDGVLGESHEGTIVVVASSDPLKTALRAGHECAHALLACRHGSGALPLWLEEGLAQLAGYRAAESVARVDRMQSIRVPPPEPWFSLDSLLAFSDYPSAPADIAAFYWQSALLVRALHARLGPTAFPALLAAVAAGTPTLDYLRTHCWFTDADFDWLRRQIIPGAPPPASSSASWLL